MSKRLLFCTLLVTAAACRRESDIQPSASSLAGEVTGTYRTNVYLDPSCVAVPADKMPYAELKPVSDSTVAISYTKLYPTYYVPEAFLRREADVVQLRVADSSVGTVQTDRVFTNNGMEKQGRLLRLTLLNNPSGTLVFDGLKQ